MKKPQMKTHTYKHTLTCVCALTNIMAYSVVSLAT